MARKLWHLCRYTELRAELGRGVSAFVSVGHRPALRDFHDQLLLIGKGDPFEVDEEGDWSSPVPESWTSRRWTPCH